jgi:glycosyltransferase involved in cell wall biosynthesis
LTPFKTAIVHQLTPKTNYTRLLQKGFDVSEKNFNILLYGGKEENVSDLPNAKNVWSSPLYPFQIFSQVLRDRPQIVHIQYEFTTFGPFWTNIFLPLLMILLKVARVKTVVTVHSVIPYSMVDRSLMQQILPELERFFLGDVLFKMFLIGLYRPLVMFVDEIIVHGNWYKKALIGSYKVVPRKVSVIPYGVDENVLPNALLYENWTKLLGNRKAILYFGNISPRKDLITLIKSFKLFLNDNPEYLLVIAGRALAYYHWYVNKIKSVAEELGVQSNLLFTGFVSDEEIHVLYELSDFIIFPYLYGFEGPSGPLAFAIQHSLPVIGNNIGHLSEEISNMNEGILVQPGNVLALSEAMKLLSNDKLLRDALSYNLTKKANGMFWKDVAHKTLQIYANLMRKTRHERNSVSIQLEQNYCETCLN